jgi:glyoxylase-like metal-dependent hydrolase (beta-lactamase superfamily II)
VRWVVNTHWHWDHTFGNAVFPIAEIWGHERCRRVLLDRPEEMKDDARHWFPAQRHAEIEEVEIVAPERVFSERASLTIGREIVMSYHGRAHTDADIVIQVPDAGVAFLGDLVEESAPPVFVDGYPLEWPETLATAAGEMTDVVVPGHGDVMDPSAVAGQLDGLKAVAQLATHCLAGEMSVEAAATEGPYPVAVMRSVVVRALEVA